MLVEQRPSHIAITAVIVPGILLRQDTSLKAVLSNDQQLPESGGGRENILTALWMDIHVGRHGSVSPFIEDHPNLLMTSITAQPPDKDCSNLELVS